jgi:hypothetical protein
MVHLNFGSDRLLYTLKTIWQQRELYASFFKLREVTYESLYLSMRAVIAQSV